MPSWSDWGHQCPGYALPEKFTLTELQHLHELLIGKSIQKRSFRRRIEQAELLVETGEMRREGGRPAALYRLKKRKDAFVQAITCYHHQPVLATLKLVDNSNKA